MSGAQPSAEDWARVVKGLEGLQGAVRGATGASNATIHVAAGGVGLWAAVTACIATLAACIPLGIVLTITVVDQGRRIDRMQDHLNAIYMIAPQLRPKNDSPK